MSVTIKICGLKTAETVDAVANAGAAFAGFVFYPPSPRDIALADAVRLVRRLPDAVRSVAVTVNAEDALLDGIVAEMRPDCLQLHGQETAERIAAVKARYGLPVIKSISVDHPGQFDTLSELRPDFFLFDAKPAVGERPGGLGKQFDWSLLNHYREPQPWFLAGGLTPDNVAEAIESSGAPAIDVSSGVERAPGVKDVSLIRSFIHAAHAAKISAA